MQAPLKDENPTDQEHQRMHHPPQPSCGGADKALFEIAPDELKQQRAPVDQIAREMSARDRHWTSKSSASPDILNPLKRGNGAQAASGATPADPVTAADLVNKFAKRSDMRQLRSH